MGDRKIIKPENVKFKSYWVCDRCKITSDTKNSSCPCPRGGCDAELIGEKEIKTTIYELEPKLCDCGKGAKWLYIPSSDIENPFYCEDCVPRGCDHCNYARKRTILGEYTEFPNGIENVDWKWVKKNDIWMSLNDGREWPCVEYGYDDEDNNFRTIDW